MRKRKMGTDDIAEEEYSMLEGDFYDSQARSLNPIRAWFHTSRNKLVAKCVRELYKPEAVVVDLACGNCIWNTEKLPVTGIDVNESMLKHAKEKGRLKEYHVGSINNTQLKPDSADIAVITETLEHIKNYPDTIAEIKRILKPGGFVVSTVPYDTNLSLWKPLFTVQCFVQGNILGKEYYKKKCGHVNHFSPKTMRQAFESQGFKVKRQFHNRFFTIFTICSKA